MKKAYIGKQGQILFEEEGRYYALYPTYFSLVIDDIGDIWKETYIGDDAGLEEIDKRTFNRQNTGRAILFVDGKEDYEKLVDDIYMAIDNHVDEELDKIDKEEKVNKEKILLQAYYDIVSSAFDKYNTSPYVYIRVEEDTGYVFENFTFLTKQSAINILKEETIDLILKNLPDIIKEWKETREDIKEYYSGPEF